MTLGQYHGKVIQYISPDPYILRAKYERFSSNGFDVRGKVFAAADAVDTDAADAAEMNWKHKVAPDRGDLKMYVLGWRTVSAFTSGYNTRVSAETVRHKIAYIILFLSRHNESKNDDKNDDLYTSSPCLTRSVSALLMTSQSIADDVTMTKQLWRDHVNTGIWFVTYRSYLRRYSRSVVKEW